MRFPLYCEENVSFSLDGEDKTHIMTLSCKYMVFANLSFYFTVVFHDPVLLSEITEFYTSLSPRHFVVDATQWLWGHTRMFLEHWEEDTVVVGIDRDRDNIRIADGNLSSFGQRHVSIESSFNRLSEILGERNFPHIDFILYDLGVSSAHYDDGDRGFSFRFDGPLDMRFDRENGKVTARDVVMNASMQDLQKMFSEYADEKKWYFVAREIFEARKTEDIDTTFKLVNIIEKASFDKKSVLRVFQALRIAVNDEFGHIVSSLEQAIECTRRGWYIAVITFHSIEDRIVKQFFMPYLQGTVDEITGQEITKPILKRTTKKPIVPTQKEIETNPRSRSAKLRVYQKNF